MGKSSSGPDVALMPGAAALVSISGGSSVMTAIFSSTMRADSEEVLVAGWASVAAAGTGEMAAGLAFSLATGRESWVEGCEGRGASLVVS